MKKTSLVALLLIMILMIVGCTPAEAPTPEAVEPGPQTEEAVVQEEPALEAVDIMIGTLKGPTGMGMAQLMMEDPEGLSLEFAIEAAPDAITAKVLNGELDFAAIPTNLASILYQKTEGAYRLAGINTLGVLYVITDSTLTIESIADLQGQSINVSGKGATPDFALRYLLENAGLDPEVDVTLDYALDHASSAQALIGGNIHAALLPQPFVTQVMMKNPDLSIGLDLTAAWEDAVPGTTMPMGGLLVKTEFADAHPEAVASFLKAYQSSVAWVNADPKAASQVIAEVGILPMAVLAEKAIPNSNIVWINGSDMDTTLTPFLAAMEAFNPKSIGGSMPDENFYFVQ
jgi:NitT/TauT family transport system substrate-binding protein